MGGGSNTDGFHAEAQVGSCDFKIASMAKRHLLLRMHWQFSLYKYVRPSFVLILES